VTWTCPECARRFGRRGQSHECAPALSIEDYFSTGPEWERPIFEAVRAHLDTLDDVHVEPVSVGIFFKRGKTFAELRPRVRWAALSFVLPAPVAHPRITRRIDVTASRAWLETRLRGPDDVDDQVRDWLTTAYLISSPA
jgi:uncharacterized protein DUF5655